MTIFRCPNCYAQWLPADELTCLKCGSGKPLPAIRDLMAKPAAEPFETWHEDDGDVLWWVFPIVEPPYVGSPLASDWPFEDINPVLGWTRLVVPESRKAAQ